MYDLFMYDLLVFHYDTGRYELLGSYPNIEMALAMGRRTKVDFFVEKRTLTDFSDSDSDSYIDPPEGCIAYIKFLLLKWLKKLGFK